MISDDDIKRDKALCEGTRGHCRCGTVLPEYIAEVERLRAAIKARAVCARYEAKP